RATLAGRAGRAPRPADGASASGAGDQALAVEQARDDTGGGDVHREEGEREPDRERDRGRDDLEGDEGGEAEHGQSGEGGELLGDPDVARSRRDGDAEPDRPEGEERDEEELGEELGRVEDDGAHDAGGADADRDQDDGVDHVGEADRGQEGRRRLAEEELAGGDGGREDGLERPLVALA